MLGISLVRLFSFRHCFKRFTLFCCFLALNVMSRAIQRRSEGYGSILNWIFFVYKSILSRKIVI
jgi:hypothetical protein